MTDAWDDVPTFGEPPHAIVPVVRPGAYAIVADADGRILVVRTPRGQLFLPGGGLEAGESPRAAVVREVREECGLVIEVEADVLRATDVVHAPDEGWFAKRSVFFRGRLAGFPSAMTEHGYEVLWLQPQHAIARLAHAGHRWAVAQWHRDPRDVA
jgi:8-oxo-dGTP diphosphatase